MKITIVSEHRTNERTVTQLANNGKFLGLCWNEQCYMLLALIINTDERWFSFTRPWIQAEHGVPTWSVPQRTLPNLLRMVEKSDDVQLFEFDTERQLYEWLLGTSILRGQ